MSRCGSGSPRLVRRDTFLVFLTVGLLSCALAACTPDVGRSAPTGIVPSPQPSPSMTPVEWAGQCVQTQETPVPLLLAVDVWPDAASSAALMGMGPTTETRPGRDPGTCRATLPPEPVCDEPFPWAGLDSSAFFVATKAILRYDDSLLVSVRSGTKDGQPTFATTTLSYTLLELPHDDPAGLHGFASRAAQQCIQAEPAQVADRPVLLGTGPGVTGERPATIVLIEEGPRLLWLTLDGPGWSPSERDRAVRVAIARLLPG